LDPLFWVLKRNPSKNREGGGVSALGGCRSGWKTQQPTKSWRLLWGGYWGGRATAVECVGGAFRYPLGRRKEDEEINNEKYIVAFGGL
jgi:hypothetical protein